MDLNLLVALDALLEENSVSAAADRLHLSAPAMSRTLTRIRRSVGDDILVRTGRTMTPTPRALELRDEVHELVRRATAALTPARTLDLDRLERVFAVRGHDALLGAVAVSLVQAVARSAPRCSVRLLGEAAGDDADLARGHVDLEIGSAAPGNPAIAAESVGADRMVVAFRSDHPLADGPLTADRLAGAEHVLVSRRGRLRDAVDGALADRGLQRRVVAALPTVAMALDLVVRTDVVVVIAERLGASPAVRTKPLPFDVPALPIVLTWHHRYDTDPARAWLRGVVRDALRADLATGLHRGITKSI